MADVNPARRLFFERALEQRKLHIIQASIADCWNRWISAFLAIAACSTIAGNQATSADKVLPIAGEVFSVAGQTAFLILPENRSPETTTPWVWYAPTLNKLPGKEETWMFRQFLDAGIAIAGIDVGESYGSPKGCAAFSALYAELVKNRGMAKQASLLARSRGGLMLYNWAAENPESVACIAGIYPVCNLASYPGLDRACGAYDLSQTQLATDLAIYNPIDRLKPLAEARVPVFHIHGDSDTVVPLEANSGVVAERFKQLGGTMTLKVVAGQGHNMWSGWFHDQELVDFVVANSGHRISASPPNQSSK